MLTTEIELPKQSLPAKERHSLFFLLVFPLFLVTSFVGISGVVYCIATGTVQDWISYWATGQQIVRHANPYDSAAIVQLERAHGLNLRTHVLIARNPPSALWTMAPLGHLPFYPGGLLWRMLQAVLVGLCVYLWWVRSGRPPGRWHLLAIPFIGTLACVSSGQSTAFVLLGVTLYASLLYHRQFAAGAALSLCAFKPHLFLPFAIVLVLWTAKHRAYRLILGLLAAFACQLLFAYWVDNHVFTDYLSAMRAEGINDQFMPAIAVVLRFVVDRHAMWLGFLPVSIASVWAVWYLVRRWQAGEWGDQIPLILLVSLIAAPYAWIVDSVLLIPAIVVLAPHCSERARAVLLLLMSVSTFQYFLAANMDSPWLLWQIPAFLGWYLYARNTVAPAISQVQRVGA